MYYNNFFFSNLNDTFFLKNNFETSCILLFVFNQWQRYRNLSFSHPFKTRGVE